MIIFLDESVPVRLARALAAVGCRAMRFPNEWKRLKNGELLDRLRESGARCLVNCDKNIEHQQNVAKTGVALVVLPRQRFEELVPIVPAIANALEQAAPGTVISIGRSGTYIVKRQN